MAERRDAREARIRQVILEYQARRNQGEEITDADVEAEHPLLAPELGERLRLQALVEAAQNQATIDTPVEHSVGDSTIGFVRSEQSSDSLAIICPQCHSSLQIPPDPDWGTVACADCGYARFQTDFDLLVAAAVRPREPGVSIGRFELVSKLGEGGFATVWKARDPQLDRFVALKIPRSDDLSADEAELFLREARAASQVRHPHVVGIHEVGRDGTTIYLVCDLIDGKPLGQWLVDRTLTHIQAVALCRTVTTALAAVHAAGIVHRDLKPSNILMDQNGAPFLADFGLAKRSADEATLTLDGQVLGTPAYMSPEQARGDSHQATVASDIYSLGVILFEMMTGVLPFRGAPHRLLEQAVRDEAPSPRSFDKTIPRDLETICLRCLEKSPAKRFSSASGFADELLRFERGEPVRSRPIRTLGRLMRWCRRKPMMAVVALLFAMLVAAGPLLAFRERWHAQTQIQLRLDADSQRGLANVRADEAEQERTAAITARNDAQTAREEALETSLRNQRLRYAADMQLIQNDLDDRDILRVQQLLDQHFPAGDQPDLRGFAWYHFWKRAHEGIVAVVPIDNSGNGGGYLLSISSDGRFAAVAYAFRTMIEVIDLETQKSIAYLQADMQVTDLHIDGDRRRVVAVGEKGAMHWWDDWSQQAHHVVQAHRGVVNTLVPFPDESGYATGGQDGDIKLWGTQPGEPPHIFASSDDLPVKLVAISPDLTSLLAMRQLQHKFADQTTLTSYDRQTEEVTWERRWSSGNTRIDASQRGRLVFDPQGRHLAFSLSRQFIGQLSSATGETEGQFESRDVDVSWLGYSPDGKRLAGLGREGANVDVWDTTTFAKTDPSLAHEGVRSAQWRKGGTLVTAGNGQLRVWNFDSIRARTTARHMALFNVEHTARASTANRFLTVAGGPLYWLWDIAESERLVSITAFWEFPVLLSPDGTSVIERSRKSVFRRMIGKGGRRIVYTPIAASDQIDAIGLSKDGQILAIAQSGPSGNNDATVVAEVVLWDLAKEQIHGKWNLGDIPLTNIAILSNPERVVAGDGRKIQCWNVESKEKQWETRITPGTRRSKAFAVTSDRIAVGSSVGVVDVLDTTTGQLVHRLTNYGPVVNDILFTPDRRELVVAYGDRDAATGGIWLWDMATGRLTAKLDEDQSPAMGLCMTSDGKTLVSAHRDGKMVFWHTATEEEIARERAMH